MVRLPDKGSEEQKAHGDTPAPTLSALSQEVKELVRLISTTDIQELHLESGQVRIIIKRGSQPQPAYMLPGAVYTPPATLPAPEASNPVNLIGHNPAQGDEISLAEGEELIVAPMLGTFYRAPSPGASPFVSEEDPVEPGQTVGIIEAMKMMNEIECDFAGRVSRILVQDAQAVEYGQPLMVVDTGG